MSHLKALAVDAQQYDKLGNDWLNEGNRDTPWRVFFTKLLEDSIGDVEGQSVLDVGCGTGWMSELVFKLGAKDYLGIEPSKINFLTAKEQYKRANFVNLPFEKFETDQKFDLVTCIMATEHLGDIESSFAKLHKLIKGNGRLIIITGDLEAFTTPKFDYQLRVEWLSKDEAIVETKRPKSVDTVDIIRSTDFFRNIAEQFGFDASVKPLMASEELIKQLPKYQMFRHRPIFQLLECRKPEHDENWGEL